MTPFLSPGSVASFGKAAPSDVMAGRLERMRAERAELDAKAAEIDAYMQPKRPAQKPSLMKRALAWVTRRVA